MKPIHIEFVKAQRWLAAWVPACLVIGAIGGTVVAMNRSMRAELQRIHDESGRIVAQAASLREAGRKATESRAADPRQAQLRAIHQRLQLDWNPAFATVENIDQPGVRLLQLDIDAGSRIIGVEYEVESFVQASTLTQAMNAGMTRSPWKLDRVSVVTAGTSMAAGRMRASWSARLDDLR